MRVCYIYNIVKHDTRERANSSASVSNIKISIGDKSLVTLVTKVSCGVSSAEFMNVKIPSLSCETRAFTFTRSRTNVCEKRAVFHLSPCACELLIASSQKAANSFAIKAERKKSGGKGKAFRHK